MTMTTCPLCETRRPYPQWGRPTETAIHLIGIATVIILISKTIIISLMGITPTMLTFEDVKLYYNYLIIIIIFSPVVADSKHECVCHLLNSGFDGWRGELLFRYSPICSRVNSTKDCVVKIIVMMMINSGSPYIILLNHGHTSYLSQTPQAVSV